jgi:hypothetical protein
MQAIQQYCAFELPPPVELLRTTSAEVTTTPGSLLNRSWISSAVVAADSPPTNNHKSTVRQFRKIDSASQRRTENARAFDIAHCTVKTPPGIIPRNG